MTELSIYLKDDQPPHVSASTDIGLAAHRNRTGKISSLIKMEVVYTVLSGARETQIITESQDAALT
jgi:hypothetical protein